MQNIDLGFGLGDLSQKRQKQLFEICTQERHDAAMNAIVIGLKSMNQVHGYGLKRLCALSELWGDEIGRFYKGGGNLYRPYPEGGAVFAGDAECDIDRVFSDLSERRRRQIRDFLDYQRRDAQWNAAMIGYDVIQRDLHFGSCRMEPLTLQWDRDIREFYQEREIYGPRLVAWMQEIGFCFDGKRLQSVRRKEDGHLVRKSTADRMIERGAGAYG